MSKTKKITVKPTAKSNKKKLSPAERSQIAKDRWANRRAGGAPKDKPDPVKEWVDEAVKDGLLAPAPVGSLISDAVKNAPEGADRIDVYSEQGSVIATHEIKSEPMTIMYETPVEVTPVVPVPAPQLAPATPKKQKRYTGPKEFSVALKAAENRLAKAIVERAQAAGQLAALQAEIPSLLGIINALKGSGNYAPPVPYDLSGGVPNAQAFQTPLQQPQFQNGPDLAAIQAAMDAAQVAIPISKARVGVQLSPEVVGSLEGPDDDEDRFRTGVGEKGWIGG